MGRGRAKAKQTRIARELKYFTPPTDLTALQHELAGVHLPEPEDTDAVDYYTRDRDDNATR
ncbi:DUF3073 domain-containing protein [Dactylosporangium aurantiacum]|uniref:DUF3073 domain-containing protein n=1 Tax=Dactylosporangium aurantiacum TaxID=35754 RepID=A0A9Q9IKI7_9ACTN|nr:DUF3073 domain-containing protein [Dactylosporangium aurantiacum]MDG6107376.1 DUF3073 domain-containing protein [Dactylosporangium aurantiacum]UWZ54495.1 DUF3073 domain-containing protein [Dactylosporangium aurantiacum]